MRHDLKILPEFFYGVQIGAKTVELRREDDRRFDVGDELVLREWAKGLPLTATATGEIVGTTDYYTGQQVRVVVTHIIRDTEWLQPGVAALSVRKVEETQSSELRPVVQWFAAQMEAKLRANDHKGGWEADHPFALAGRIYDEWRELGKALNGWAYKGANTEAVINECSDVANFALMVADVVRKKGE